MKWDRLLEFIEKELIEAVELAKKHKEIQGSADFLRGYSGALLQVMEHMNYLEQEGIP